MFKLKAEQKRWWEFLLVMTGKEIRLKYKMTFLGFFWAFLNPLVQMFVTGYVFSFFLSTKINNYFIFVFSGLLLWNFFISTILRSVTIIIDNRHLIQKAKFPKEVLVISVTFANFIHLLISFSILAVISIFTGCLSWWWIFLPLVFILLFFLTIGFSLLFAAVNVRHRDVNLVIQTIATAWFYLTPIVYTLDLVPSRLVYLFFLNPMTGILDLCRLFFLQIPLTFCLIDLVSVVLSIFIFIFGVLVFKKTSLFFNDWV
jgi:ABC-2 type transport system permease protein